MIAGVHLDLQELEFAGPRGRWRLNSKPSPGTLRHLGGAMRMQGVWLKTFQEMKSCEFCSFRLQAKHNKDASYRLLRAPKYDNAISTDLHNPEMER